MKNVLAVCFLLFAVSGCKKEETTPQTFHTPKTETPTIQGRWDLKRYDQGWMLPQLFNPGEIEWQFTTNNQVGVNIAEGTEVNPYMPLNSTGIYNFEIIDSNHVMVDSLSYHYAIQGDSLILDHHIAVDGMRFIFKIHE